MNPTRKILRAVSFVLFVAVAAATFSGCISRPKTETKKAESITLVYYKLFDDEDTIQPMIQAYTGKNPGVKIIYKKFTDPVEFENMIVNEMAEGEGPDIFSAPNSWFLRNVKKISPMPAGKMTVKEYEDTFVDVAKSDLVLRDPADGEKKIFGIPLTVDTLALYFNKGTYNDKVPFPGRPAATWEGLKEDVFKLSKTDQSFERFQVAGIAMGRSDNIARAVDILYMLMLQNKTRFYNSNVSKAQFASQSVIGGTGLSLNPATEALDLYTSFALATNKNYSWNQYLASASSSVKEMETFARGKVTMIFGYSYLYQQILDQIGDLKKKGVQTMNESDVRISVVPQVNDPATSSEKRVAYASYYAETVSRTSAHPEQAWDFLVFISGKDNLAEYNRKTHRPTSRRDMIEDQMKDPVYGVFAEQIGYAESFPIYDSGRYAQIFAKAIDSVVSSIQKPSAAVRVAEDAINEMLPAEGLVPPAPKEDASDAKQTTTQQK